MDQRPLELILARNFLTSLSTPAFLVDEGGGIVFYNEAAGGLLGISFEEFGQKPADDPTTRFMLTHKADTKSEAGVPYPPEVDAGMQKLVADMTAAGVFIQSGGLEPSSKATRKRPASSARLSSGRATSNRRQWRSGRRRPR